ncbi:MAG: hypothetical protein ACOC7U_03530 [Spirochaetota bacterium]
MLKINQVFVRVELLYGAVIHIPVQNIQVVLGSMSRIPGSYRLPRCLKSKVAILGPIVGGFGLLYIGAPIFTGYKPC